MKANLLICLGNPLMGDEGAGWSVYTLLSNGASLPGDFELIYGGTDLLRLAGAMEGRRRIILVDALEDPSAAGDVVVFEDDFLRLDEGQPGAHRLSAVQAVRLLRLASAELRNARFTLIGVAISEARFGEELSPGLAARLPFIAEEIRRHCASAG